MEKINFVNNVTKASAETFNTMQDNIENAINEALLNIYPIGSIYMSVNSTNPGTLFGGTWEQIKDKFLLSAGDTYSAGSTGGEATHILTVDEIPSHNHLYINDGNYGITAGASALNPVWGSRDGTTGATTGSTGGDQPHNNMPPYLTVYVWKRTA